jgi:hypothetical protein
MYCIVPTAVLPVSSVVTYHRYPILFVTQETLHTSNFDLPISFTLGPTLPFPFTDSQGLFPQPTYINRKTMALLFPVLSFISTPIVVIAVMQQKIPSLELFACCT